ncbi:MAG: hypothetical protein H6735_16565 [Alphaproteobacteria bacterium]|nr:hypothetical protein [Alphaproteobacteria bacterium]
MWWLVGAVATAAECDVNTEVVSAYGALLGGDTSQASDLLGRAEDHLACTSGLVDPQSLARFWLVEGALLLATGEDDADPSFAAARRVADDLWLPNLGDAARQRWSSATDESGDGRIELDVAVTNGVVAVDGRAIDLAEPVVPGLHAVQVADARGTTLYGAIVYVGSGTVTTVTTNLPQDRFAPSTPTPTPAPAPVPAPRPPKEGGPRPMFAALTGASTSFGEALEATDGGQALTEPGVKLVVPLELSAGVRAGPGWVRLAAGGGWLVGGPWLSAKADGSLHTTPVRVDVGVAGGFATGDLRVGAASGIAWPGRLSERVLAGYDLAGPLTAELRAGINLATERPIEPAIELLVGVIF